MILHPEVQRRAQEEIDRVIGHARLPTMEDRTYMPYIECVVKEALRWNIIVPAGAWLVFFFTHQYIHRLIQWSVGTPHRLLEDDYYEGKLEVEGTRDIVANLNLTLFRMLYSQRLDCYRQCMVSHWPSITYWIESYDVK